MGGGLFFMSEKTWCVYKHTNKANGKVYIGITCKKPERRWEAGNGYRHNAHMDSAIKKFGWDNFDHEVLYEGLSEDEALDLERKLISEYQSADRRYGYNIEAGGRKKGSYSAETLEKMRQRMLGPNNHNYGKHLSEETRRKLSECNRGERHPKYGTHHSEETRRKLSEQKRGDKNWNYGKKTPEEVKEKMRNRAQCKRTLCVETGVVYRSVREASRQTGINIAGICLACRGERLKTAGGYHWKFVEVAE
jgi:group I intron endonuclease